MHRPCCGPLQPPTQADPVPDPRLAVVFQHRAWAWVSTVLQDEERPPPAGYLPVPVQPPGGPDAASGGPSFREGESLDNTHGTCLSCFSAGSRVPGESCHPGCLGPPRRLGVTGMWSALQTSYLDPGAGHTHSPPSLLQKHRAASGVAIQTADILVSPQRRHQGSRWGLCYRKGTRVPLLKDEVPRQTGLLQLPWRGFSVPFLSMTWEGPAPGSRQEPQPTFYMEVNRRTL